MANNSDHIIELRRVHKSFGSQQVLRGINMTIPRGRTSVIIGLSGSGKSVILKHMIGLIKPDRGEVLIDGMNLVSMDDRQLNRVRRRFGMLFQDAALFDSMNVGDNVAFPLREHTKLQPPRLNEIVREKLRMVGLRDMEHKLPSQLSGGMRKRVGLARAIALEPEIILFDEPTTGLDPLMTDAINGLIKDIQERLGVTAVVISHDIKGAFAIGHHVIMLYKGQVEVGGSPEEMMDHPSEVLRQFLSGRTEGPIEVI